MFEESVKNVKRNYYNRLVSQENCLKSKEFYKALLKMVVDIPKYKHELIDAQSIQEWIDHEKKERNRKYHLFIISIILCRPSMVEYFYSLEQVSKVKYN